MRNYEAMLLIRPNLDEEALTQAIDKYSNLITQNGGEIEKVDKLGKRRLQYEIEKLKEAHYVLYYFKGEPNVAQEMERVMKISDDVFRFLVIRKEA